MDTGLVAEQFGICRRRVQQLAKKYRDSGEIPKLETPGREAYQKPLLTSCELRMDSASPLTVFTRFSMSMNT